MTDHTDIADGIAAEGFTYADIYHSQALYVTAGPHSGRIGENDDDAFTFVDEFEDWELEEYLEAGMKLRRLESDPDDAPGEAEDELPLGVDCQVMTFGHYLLSRGYYLIPNQFLRPANMKDLIQRYEEISGEMFARAWTEHPDEQLLDLTEELIEQAYIREEVREREMLARSADLGDLKIFLCHSSGDKPFVRRVHGDLAKAGHKAWIDEVEIKVGDSIVQKIDDAIERANVLVLFISKASIESLWVKKEWQSVLARLLSGSNISILPALLEETPVPAILSDIKYADFRNSYSEGLRELATAINTRASKDGNSA